MLSAPKCYYPLQTQTSNSSTIEYVSVQLILLSGYNLIILVVYRPPSLSLDTSLTDILQILHTSASNLPSIILGDFNEDIGSPRYCRIEHLFATFQFNQIVRKPTTDSGTCIDYVYCNIHNEDIIVDIHDMISTIVTMTWCWCLCSLLFSINFTIIHVHIKPLGCYYRISGYACIQSLFLDFDTHGESCNSIISFLAIMLLPSYSCLDLQIIL